MVTGGPASLRPLGAGEVLDTALRVVRARPALLLGAGLLSALPEAVLTQLGSAERPLLQSLDLLLSTAAYGLVGGVGAVAVAEVVAGRRVDVRAVLSARGSALAAASWLYALAVVGLGLLLVVPGVWAVVAFSLVLPVVALEGAGPWAALGRSRRLVQGSWWSTAGRLLLGTAVAGAVTMVLAVPLLLVGGDSAVPVTAGDRLAALGSSAVVGVVLVPYLSALAAVLHLDLRVRREAFDLQVPA